MDRKYTIELNAKSYFSYCLYELKSELIFLSALIFLGFGGYATWITLDYFGGEETGRALLNIGINVAIILAAIAVLIGVVILLSWFIAKSKISDGQIKKLTIKDDTFSFDSDTVKLTVSYEAVKNFVELKNVLALNVAGMNALVIPKNSLPANEMLEVIEFLSEKTAKEPFAEQVAYEQKKTQEQAEINDELFDEQNEEN